MRPIHLHALNLALAGGLLVLTGCGDQSSSGTERPSDAANLPTLLMPAEKPDESFGFDALVGGELGINEQNCFTVGGNVLLAPWGSEVWADGAGVTIPGLGRIAIGEKVRGGGGYLDFGRGGLELPDTIRPCVGDAKQVEVARLNQDQG